MNGNVNILKQSGSMLLIHSQLTMGLTNYFFTNKEKSLLQGTEKLCRLEMDFCLKSRQSVLEGEEPLN